MAFCFLAMIKTRKSQQLIRPRIVLVKLSWLEPKPSGKETPMQTRGNKGKIFIKQGMLGVRDFQAREDSAEGRR